MSPEERAKTICTILEADTSARLEGDDWATLERLIVEAIRDAEDAALERAASAIEPTFTESLCGIVDHRLLPVGMVMTPDSEMLVHMSRKQQRIRSLKSKQEF